MLYDFAVSRKKYNIHDRASCLSWDPEGTASVFTPPALDHSVSASSANFCAMVGLFLVSRFMVRSSALLLVRRRLFSED